MPPLITNRDLKSLVSGVAVAAAAGLLTGAAMQPNLRADLRPEGPQMLAGVSGPRADQPYGHGAAFTRHDGEIPDYVVGTDWLRPPEWLDDLDDAYVETPADDWSVALDEYEPQPVQVARIWEPPREPPAYPSISGGVPYGADLPPPPPPPVEEARGGTIVIVGG